jgi:hypothetical protein
MSAIEGTIKNRFSSFLIAKQLRSLSNAMLLLLICIVCLAAAPPKCTRYTSYTSGCLLYDYDDEDCTPWHKLGCPPPTIVYQETYCTVLDCEVNNNTLEEGPAALLHCLFNFITDSAGLGPIQKQLRRCGQPLVNCSCC